MKYKEFGKTGWKISTISFGAWAIGSSWGSVDDQESLHALHRALEMGVNLFDTADVYGNGRSERLLAQLRKESRENFYIATKIGRRLNPHIASGYNRENLTAYVDRSLENLNTDALDLVQLHCPPTDVYYNPDVFEIMDDLVKAGKIRYYGVSVEKVEEALKAIDYPNVSSVQIIFNIFRQRPIDLFFNLALHRKVAVLARVPLASGMLTGKMRVDSHFEKDDHRNYNRKGEKFDRGETFAGVDFETGLKVVEKLRALLPPGVSLTQFSLRWITMFDAVSCAIPGAKRSDQVAENAAAADIPPLSPEIMAAVRQIYEQDIRPLVHHYW